MGETFQRRISALLLSNRRHARWAAMVACMAVLVALGVTVGLTQKGQAKTHEETVLDCQYSGGGAHTHDASCYDADGNLVCPLEERELHVHDDSCYASETRLVCGMEEGEGAHTHTDECYDEEGNLVCGLEESEGHVHDDSCWQTDTWLACGKEEVTEEHVHGEACFKTIVVEDEEPEPEPAATEAEPAAEAGAETEAAEDAKAEDDTKPAADAEADTAKATTATEPAKAKVADDGEQTFAGELKDADGNVVVAVNVKAPKGALPDGATMRVKPVDENAIKDKVDEAVRAEAGEGKVAKSIMAVDIAFLDEDGAEVEPTEKVEVKITTALVRDVDAPALVHIDEKQDTAEVVRDTKKVNADEKDTTTGNEDTLKFDTDEFSPYVVVEVAEATQTTELQAEADTVMPAQDFEGQAGDVTVVVKAPEGAFPEGTIMAVEAVDSDEVIDSVEGVAGKVGTLVVVDITFWDADGNEIQPEKPVKVTMSNSVAPEQGNPVVVHVDDEGNASVVEQSMITTANDEAIFNAASFSKYSMAYPANGEIESADKSIFAALRAPVPSQSGSILESVTYDDKNGWQIVEGEYTGNTPSEKPTTDGDVRVQKNVIPTGIENEFYVYLSVDTRLTEEMMSEIMKNATYKYASSQHFPEPVEPAKPHSGKWGSPGDLFNGVQGSPKDDGDHSVEIKMFHDGIYVGSVWVSAECSNYQCYLMLGTKTIGITDAAHGYNTPVDLSDAAYEELINYYYEQTFAAELNSVIDQLGSNIELISDSFMGDFATTPSVSGDTITWIPKSKTNPQKTIEIRSDGTTKDIWSLNVAELVYKVRLDVTKDDFVSCADNMDSVVGDDCSYMVNDHATLTHDGSKTLDFPVPYVRGLLYDLQIKKVDETGKPLAGAVFSITGTSGTTGKNVAAVEAAKLTEDQLTSGEDGLVTVTGLPWGTYTITEVKPPKGYMIDPLYKVGKPVTLCQTTDAGALADNGTHRILKEGTETYLKVVNRLNKITFTKQVGVKNDLTLREVDHKIYIALWHGGNNGDYLRDDNGNIVFKTITITDGVPSPVTVTFEGVDSDFYDVYELAEVNGPNYKELGIAHDILVNSEEREFQLIAIEGNNEADLLNTNTASVTLKNIYSDPVDIPFVANKVWGDPEGNRLEEAPDATVTFTLYRKLKSEDAAYWEKLTELPTLDGQGTRQIQPITLDGVADEQGETKPWEATFEDLPVRDNDGNLYDYAVKETNCSSKDFQLYDKSEGAFIVDPDSYYMNINGGNVWNVQKTTSITVKKEDNNNTFVPGAWFKLFRVGETDEVIGEQFEVPSDGKIITGLTSGTYKLTEVKAPNGYIIMDEPLVFTVNATGDDNPVIAWAAETPTHVKPLSGTNYDTITVINTPGQELPMTGGPGTTLFTITGSAVLAMAVSYGISSRRRRERGLD